MKMGSKLMAGFGSVTALTVALGLLAIAKMKHVTAQAKGLAQERIPEVKVANQVERASLLAMYEIRGYGCTDETNYLARGTRHLQEVRLHLQEAAELGGKTAGLDRLKQAAAVAGARVAEYEELVQSTVASTDGVAESRRQLDAACARFKKECADYLESQQQSLNLEVATNASSALLAERFRKINLAHEIVEAGDACNVAVWRAQAGRDLDALKATDKYFDAIDRRIDDIRPLTRQAKNLQQLANCKAATEAYKKGLASMCGLWRMKEELARQRGEAAQAVLNQASNSASLGLIDTSQATQSAADSLSRASAIVFVGLVLAVLLSGGGAFFIARSITKPLRLGVGFSERVARGDLTQKLDLRRQDEIGQLARALDDMVVGLRSSLSTVAQNAQAVAASSHELSATSTQVSANSEETSSQSNVVASAAEQVSKNVATVASSAEQLSATTKEIAKQTCDASKVAGQAVAITSQTNETILKLGESSNEIGNVVKVITSIAEQTNLLALNATIEAARAGQAGKGFAVVADEVKALARQTSDATEDIRKRIDAIQTDTQTSVEAIRQVSNIIQKINEIQSTVAAAVEEQATSLNEISKNSREAAQGSSEIARNILSVSEAAGSSAKASQATSQAAQDLARLAADLSGVVAQFKLNAESSPHELAVAASVRSVGGNGSSRLAAAPRCNRPEAPSLTFAS